MWQGLYITLVAILQVVLDELATPSELESLC
jgi:hypothetical protein